MMIIVYLVCTNIVFPSIEKYASSVLGMMGPFLIAGAGIVLLFGALGFRISQNLGATIVGSLFRAAAYLVQQAARGVVWLVVRVARLIPMVFVGTRRALAKRVANSIICNCIAVLTTVLFIAVVI